MLVGDEGLEPFSSTHWFNSLNEIHLINWGPRGGKDIAQSGCCGVN